MENKLYGTVLLKAKQILDYIARTKDGVTLNDLSKNLDISKPTIYKILKTLEFCGYVRVVFVGEEKFYHLGTIFLQYAQSVNDSINIVEIANPFLKKLRDETAETVNLGIEEDNSIVLLSKMESTHSIKLVSVVGGKMHMFSSSMGKAILATYSQEQLDEYLATVEFQKMTENTITNKKDLIADLEKTRAQGFSIDNVENQPGVYCLGFTLTANGKVYGAFSISTPEFRMNAEKRDQFIALGKQIQQEIEQHL
jgi:DNA-binding IclR family transcriptional regulator